MFLRLVVFGIVLRLLSIGASQEEDDQLRPAQQELMTPESTSSVFHCGRTLLELSVGCC